MPARWLLVLVAALAVGAQRLLEDLMALNRYGVFRGAVASFHSERDDDASPHFQLFLRAAGQTVRCAVNVKSKLPPSRLAFYLSRRFEHPITGEIRTVSPGFTELPSSERRGLDYVRSNLFDLEEALALPHDAPGQEDDLQDAMMSLCQSAQAGGADVYVFGEPFPNGMHDIHMNQGNSGQFAGDNGIFQDGGLLIRFPSTNRWSALFLAFQSQAIRTDDGGAPLPGSPTFATVIGGGVVDPIVEPADPASIESEQAVRMIAALVNPEGAENQPAHTGRPESVTLFNYSPESIALDGWRIEAKGGSRSLENLRIAPGDSLRIELDGSPPLGNKGGTISLVNARGAKVHGVSYTAEQAGRKKEGWSIRF